MKNKQAKPVSAVASDRASDHATALINTRWAAAKMNKATGKHVVSDKHLAALAQNRQNSGRKSLCGYCGQCQNCKVRVARLNKKMRGRMEERGQ